MRSIAGLLVSTLILITLIFFTWMHFKRSAEAVEIKAAPLIEQARKAQQAASESQGSQSSVSLAGPLAQYVNHKADDSNSDKIETITYTPVASDHVGGSVVGTSITILKDKFRVANVVMCRLKFRRMRRCRNCTGHSARLSSRTENHPATYTRTSISGC